MKDIVISMPAIVGKDGVENVIPISLDEEEKMQLKDQRIFNRDERNDKKRTRDRLKKQDSCGIVY